MTTLTISLMVCGVVLITHTYFLLRIRPVMDFRCRLARKCINRKSILWMAKKHTFNRMVMSFRPLTLEKWFTENEIRIYFKR